MSNFKNCQMKYEISSRTMNENIMKFCDVVMSIMKYKMTRDVVKCLEIS